MDFKMTFEKGKFGKKLHMHKALDRIKYISRGKKNQLEFSPDDFKKIEARMNPKDAKVPADSDKKHRKEPKSREKSHGDTSFKKDQDAHDQYPDGAKRIGTAN